MKTNSLLLIAALSLTGIFTACSLKEEMKVSAEGGTPVSITVSVPDEGLKVSMTQSSNLGSVKLAWESTDVITVKNADDEEKEVVFTCTSGAGSKTATFTAQDGIAALAGASRYNILLTSRLSGSFTSQTQASNGSTSHLGYAAVLSNVNTYDGATFSQSWATSHGSGSFATSSVLRLSFQM